MYEPWYRDQEHTYFPFNLVRKPHSTSRTQTENFRTLAAFPWTNDSLSTLWKGTLNTEEYIPDWKKMIAEYWDAVAVGSDLTLFVFFTHKRSKQPLGVRLPVDKQELIDADVMSIAWSLSHHAPFEPVIIFSRGSVAYIYNVVREGMSGYIRGHGGAITSIAVHPTTTHLFSTTSRDHSTRIYDLTLAILTPSSASKSKKKSFPPSSFTKEEIVSNPHWPPNMRSMSFAGAAHGLHLWPSEMEDEGRGLGRCIIVLMGGRSGGHNDAVLGADFHPIYPVVATCGMDRFVKIWPIRSTNPIAIKREDKPLFSSSRIHKARVLSVHWLQDDLLLTHSAPAIMKRYPKDRNNKETYLEPGELIVWKWLGVNRFFPPRYEETGQNVWRGCSSDYQESASFKMISIHRFKDVPDQYTVPRLNLFHTPVHDPVVSLVYPESDEFLLVNLAHLKPKPRPVFPLEYDKVEVKGGKGKEKESVDAAHDEEEEAEDGMNIDKTPILNGREEIVPPELEGWKIRIEAAAGVGENVPEGNRKTPHLMNCALGMGGRVIVGVGSASNLWVWDLDLGSSALQLA